MNLMRNAELYFKAATVIYGLEPLEARFPQLVSKVRLLPLVLHRVHQCRREYQSKFPMKSTIIITSGMSVDQYEFAKIHVAEVTRDRWYP